ncbi:GNAT family N-acetyltransferase [Traorella massiliensis]|uniref:GNAT family N-acetyltransferase n=1 Tax=Traorella massiliensis TaxID=1903263 RepID=UPI0023565145|nr:GNAT family N-acetyltransferase [Traorella massiliensis]
MKIREIKESDYPVIDKMATELQILHVNHTDDIFKETAHAYSYEEFLNCICDDRIALIAEEGNDVLGYCFANVFENPAFKDRTLHISDLFVDQHARRKGVAKALLDEAVKRAKRLGAKRMQLMVWSFNEEARHLYESYGMEIQSYNYGKKI